MVNRTGSVTHLNVSVGFLMMKTLTSLPVILIWVQRLVAGSVTFDSLLEIHHGVRLVAVPVVWTGHLHFLHRIESCQTANNVPDAREIYSFLVEKKKQERFCHVRGSP